MALGARSHPPIPRRRVRFEHADDLPLVWTPLWPELSFVANAVSLLMPHVEPYFVRTVRAARARVDDPVLRRDLDDYAAQEAAHHAQHRRFSDFLVARCPGLARVERWIERTVGFLDRRGEAFGLAFAAGGEAVAYGAARWVAPRMNTLFTGADPEAASMFVWHLAEEVEHKRVAFDVYDAVAGSRWKLAKGMLAAFVLLAAFTILSTMVMLWSTRRIWNPLAHVRLLVWGVQFAFATLPVLAVALTRSHHPDDLVDPSWYATWLGTFDPQQQSAPHWQPPSRVAS